MGKGDIQVFEGKWWLMVEMVVSNHFSYFHFVIKWRIYLYDAIAIFYKVKLPCVFFWTHL